MSSDLVGAHYPENYVFDSITGQARNATQGNIPIYSNRSIISGSVTDVAAALVTGVMTLVPIPIDLGVNISKIAMFIGASAASTPTHQFAALYSGTLTTATLLGAQSADGLTAVQAASARFDFTLPGSGYTIQPADAPFGYIYAGISTTGTAVASLRGAAWATAVQYADYGNAPLFMAGTVGSALAGLAPATVTLASVSKIATIPVIDLR